MTERMWMQVSAGRGPAECQLAVGYLTGVLQREAAALGIAADMIDSAAGEVRGGLMSALISLSGPGAADFAARNRGSVVWIAPSPLRPTHRRKNWFVAVDVLSPPDEVAAGGPRAADVTFEAMRASGPGGQHVNKTESAVRATHRPTGLVAVAREERSQAMNKRLALARLAQMLAESAEAARAGAGRDRWARHDQLERGKAVRRFRGADFREERA